MVEVKWTDFAIQNLNEIGDYIEKESYTSYASRVVSGLFAAVDVLERFPLAGRMVPEFQDTAIRELIRMNHYRIVYRVVNESRIDILTVHHSARILHTSILTMSYPHNSRT
ncbi:MAG: type II toxin-antitoxin system RelE/ParE family toxin [Parabacteroides sp.]|nr:type II toxin-antitoxin system RelE/ParE family toxin [Parabacteroides sp.]